MLNIILKAFFALNVLVAEYVSFLYVYDLPAWAGFWSAVSIRRYGYFTYFKIWVLLITRFLWLVGRLGFSTPV